MRRRAAAVAVMVLMAGLLVMVAPSARAAGTCFGKPATVQGVPPDPGEVFWTFTGTDGPDVIVGTDSYDLIKALGGNDLVCARGGPWDIIHPGLGNDRVRGEGGDDDVEGAAGRDVLWGGGGSDVVWGLGGGSTFYGGPGNDLVDGDSPDTAERAYGEAGDDRLVLDAGGPADVVNGGVGTDTCAANRADQVTGCEVLG